jgi:hypothetical protein
LKNLLNTQQRSLRRLQRVEDADQARNKETPDANPLPHSVPPTEETPDTDPWSPPYVPSRTHAQIYPSLTSTLLSQAVPYSKSNFLEPPSSKIQPLYNSDGDNPQDNPTAEYGSTAGYKVVNETNYQTPYEADYKAGSTKGFDSSTAVGVSAPAHSDNIQLLLSQWTRPSPSESRASKHPEVTAPILGVLGGKTRAATVAAHSARRKTEEATQGMEALLICLQISVEKRLKDNNTLLENLRTNFEQRVTDARKVVDSGREELNATHKAELQNLEKQLLVRESKEAAVCSLILEVGRSYKELQARETQQPAETSHPLELHVKRLEERLMTEAGELASLKEWLTGARSKALEEYNSKLLELEKKEIGPEEVARNEGDIQKLKEEHLKLVDLLDKNSGEMTRLRDQWLALMEGIGWVFLDLDNSESDSTASGHSFATPEWLDEGISECEFANDEGEQDDKGRDSDKIPVELEDVQLSASSDKIPVEPEDVKVSPSSDKIFDPSENETKPSPPVEHPPKAQAEVPLFSAQELIVAHRCWRQAWKAPQPFQSGYNTFANILKLNTERWWFKASRDEYQFFLESRPEPFYTIELVPAELRTFRTSIIEWTVLQKAWASSDALSASGYIYREDSDGHFWIQKELNWVCKSHIVQHSVANIFERTNR